MIFQHKEDMIRQARETKTVLFFFFFFFGSIPLTFGQQFDLCGVDVIDGLMGMVHQMPCLNLDDCNDPTDDDGKDPIDDVRA